MAREVTYRGSVSEWARKQQDEPDLINAPPHYKKGKIECWDAIEAALTPEEFRGYCKGTALAYIWRERHKGGDQDLGKADVYLKRTPKQLKEER